MSVVVTLLSAAGFLVLMTLGIAATALFVAAYFAPTVIAFLRGNRDFRTIAVLNLTLGWTVIGWLGCFAWAVNGRGALY